MLLLLLLSTSDIVPVLDSDALGHVVDLVYTDETRCKFKLETR